MTAQERAEGQEVALVWGCTFRRFHRRISPYLLFNTRVSDAVIDVDLNNASEE